VDEEREWLRARVAELERALAHTRREAEQLRTELGHALNAARAARPMQPSMAAAAPQADADADKTRELEEQVRGLQDQLAEAHGELVDLRSRSPGSAKRDTFMTVAASVIAIAAVLLLALRC
jgi:hypothetical protein